MTDKTHSRDDRRPPRREPDEGGSAYDDSAYLNTQPVDVVPDAESQLESVSTGIASAVLGVLMIAGGVVTLIDASMLRAASDPLGPAAMPTVVGIGLLVVGVLLVVSNSRSITDAARIGVRVERRRVVGVVVLLVAVIAFAFVLPIAGFVVSSALLFVVAALALDAPRRWSILAIGIVIASLVYLLFDRLIGLTLPAGPWGF